MMNRITSLFAALALTVALAPGALADPPEGKGQGQGANKDAQQGYSYENGKGNSSGKGQSGNKGSDHDYDDYDPYHDKYKGSKEGSNHGQRVSDCNHRANERKLKGQDRHEYVEWCVDNGDRYKYDDNRWSQGQNCYRKANDKNLSGDARRRYLNDCLEKTYSSSDKQKKSIGIEDLGKATKKN